MKKAPLKIILGLQFIGLAAYADDFTWNVASGDWNNPANWTTINPGGPQDRFVNNGGTAFITADTNLPIRDIKIGLGAGTSGFVVQSAGVATTGGGNWAFIGDSGGTGTYTISGGSLIGSGRFLIGDLGTGFLNVSGSPATSVRTDGEFWVGNGAGGSGTVTQTGGTVTSNDWLAIGRDQATGKYDLIDGALQHTGPNNTIIGSLSGRGTLNQTGGTFFEQNDLRLGENAGGDGAYNLSAGTATINGWVGLGWTGGGKGTITVSGTGELKVLNQHIEIGGAAGGTGDGTLNLNGGTVQTNTLTRVLAGIAQVNFNGGVFKAASSQGEFLPNFDAATTEVQAGGLKVDTNGFNLATAVGFDGIGGLTKLGAGTLTLNGVSTYTGMTIVSQGTLALGPSGSINPSSVVNVAPGAILDASAAPLGYVVPVSQTITGSGTVIGNTTVNGVVSPGNSLGILTFSNTLTLNGGTVMEIDRTGAPASDRIVAGGPIDFGGDLDVTLAGGSLQLGDSFDLFDAPSFFDVFATIDLPALPGDWYWSTTLPNSDPRNQLDNNGTIQVLPEPASAILGGIGLLGLLARRRRA